MSNFFNSFLLGFLFCCSIQIFSHTHIEASEKPFEYYIDLVAFDSMSTIERIDCFIDAGIESAKSHRNKFDYKKTLKKTYKYLKAQGMDIPKEIKKDVNKRVSNRIAERYFAEKNPLIKALNSDGSFKNETLERYRNEEADCKDSMRGSVVGFCVGVGMVCSRNPTAVKIGLGVAASEGWALYSETKAYIYDHWYSDRSTSNERSNDNGNGRHSERKRDMTRD